MAMRTATPLVTCWVTTVRGRSATSEAISTPRTIGPGWVTMASSPSRCTRRGREPPARRVLAQRGDERAAPPLGLEAEQRDDVGVAQGVVEVGGHLDRPALERGRQQAARGGQGDVGSQGGVGQHLGASHPAVPHVADDQDAQPLEAGDAELVGRGALAFGQHLAHGEAVQQGLRRVLVPAVARVDDRGPLHPTGDLVRRARRAVPDDDGVDAHGLDRLDGVAQALALLDRRRGHREREHVGREALGRGLEGEPGAGRLLEEEGGHHLAAQGRHLGHRAPLHLGEGLGHPEHLGDAVGAAQVGHREQVLGSAHSLLQGADPDAVLADVDHLLAAGGQVLAHEVGADGQLAVAAVDHDGQLDGPGPAEVVQRVEGGPDGPPGEEHVVDQHHHPAGQVDRDVGDRLGQDGAQADVVAVEGHIERAQLRGRTPSIWRRISAIGRPAGRHRSGAR